MATGKGTDAFRYDEQIVRCDDCEATGPLCEMDNGEGWEADRLHGGDTVPLGLHVTCRGGLHAVPTYWPSTPGDRLHIDDYLNDVIAEIRALTDDPVERDALAQHAGDQIRLHVTESTPC